jgi:SAM-dependent methyltransferase
MPASAHLTATDLNVDMQDIARDKFRSDEQVAFQPADATALPFPDASFDTVICQFGVMFFPDKDKSYREVHRVIVSGGRYLFNVWDSHRHNPFGRIAHEVIGSFFPADPPKFYEVPFSYHLIDPIKEALIAAGFGGIEVSVVQLHRTVADFSAFARGVVFGNPVFDQIRRRGAGPDPGSGCRGDEARIRRRAKRDANSGDRNQSTKGMMSAHVSHSAGWCQWWVRDGIVCYRSSP